MERLHTAWLACSPCIYPVIGSISPVRPGRRYDQPKKALRTVQTDRPCGRGTDPGASHKSGSPRDHVMFPLPLGASMFAYAALGGGNMEAYGRSLFCLLPNDMGPDSRARYKNPGVESADEDLTPPKLDAVTHCRPVITSGPSSPELVTCSIYLEHCSHRILMNNSCHQLHSPSRQLSMIALKRGHGYFHGKRDEKGTYLVLRRRASGDKSRI